MKDNILFSIVIPTYNRSGLLIRAIESVLKQEYTNFELIIVDDGSTDNTEEVVKKYAEKDNRIRYYYKINEERSIARNFGTKKATGDYINFLDSDDSFYSNHLLLAEKNIKRLNHPEMIHLGYDVKNENEELISQVTVIPNDVFSKLLRGTFLSCNGVVIKKEIALQFPFIEDRNFNIMEDWLLWLKIGSRYTIHHIPEITSTAYAHNERSVLIADKNRLLNNCSLFIKYLYSDVEFATKYGEYKNSFRAITYSYVALHLSLQKKYRMTVLLLLSKAVIADPRTLRERRFYACLKHLF